MRCWAIGWVQRPDVSHVSTTLTLKTSKRALAAKAAGPKVSANLRPWYPSDGSVNDLNFPDAQSKEPPETTTPPMVVPCPPIHLVADWTTMSAPCSIGRTM
jgi:hypothetical protein